MSDVRASRYTDTVQQLFPTLFFWLVYAQTFLSHPEYTLTHI